MREKIIDALNGMKLGMLQLDDITIADLNAASRLAQTSTFNVEKRLQREVLRHMLKTSEGWVAMLEALIKDLDKPTFTKKEETE